MNMKLEFQTEHFLRKLGRAGNSLQQVAADTINESAEKLDDRYQKKLKTKQKLRAERFTLGGIKTFKATPVRRSGEPRRLDKINAVVGVRKMKGGKESYLSKLERGARPKANPKTRNRVPVPLDAARISKSDDRPVSSPLRLMKGQTQTLQVSGKPIGVRGDGYASNRRRWGALYGSVRSGKVVGDPKKPFFMIDNQNKAGIFKFFGRTARKIRSIEHQRVKSKARPHFKQSFKETKPADIQRLFVKKAKRKLGR